jgi:hypothetical protein
MRRQKVLNRTVLSITQIQSVLNSLMNQIYICYCLSQIFEFCYFFDASDCYFYIKILSCILVTRVYIN